MMRSLSRSSSRSSFDARPAPSPLRESISGFSDARQILGVGQARNRTRTAAARHPIQARVVELRQLLEEWDFVGVRDFSAHDDEYDRLLGPRHEEGLVQGPFRGEVGPANSSAVAGLGRRSAVVLGWCPVSPGRLAGENQVAGSTGG
jgi:hypothetical protein